MYRFAITCVVAMLAACGGTDTREDEPESAPVEQLGATLSASPQTIDAGQSATLTWSSDNATSCTASGDWSGSKALSGSESTGALTQTRTYVLACAGGSQTVNRTATVTVSQPAAAPTVSLSAQPTSVQANASSTLTWSSTGATECTATGAWSGSKSVSGSQSTGALTAPSNTFTLSCTGAGGTANASAVVSVSSPGAPAPTVTISANPTSVATGGSATLTWSSTNATACTSSGAWSGSRPLSGSTGTGALSAPSNTFSLSCTGSGGTANGSATVTVAAPVPAPSLSLSASPTSVASGGTTTLTWSSTNATACTASGAWSGSRPTSGSASSASLTAASNAFNLSCTGPGGSVNRTATVTVTQTTPEPTITFSANPTNVSSGQSSTLTWSTSEASSCTASGAWSGSRATSGSESTGALTQSTNTFTLSCTGEGGTASRSVNVTVGSSTETGLDFQGNDSTTGTVRFRFTNPLAIYPATYIWKVRPRQQSGYYTTFFWGNDGHFWWDAGSPDTYYGPHPYPQPPPSGSTHKWEIAVGGGDFLSSENVVYDRWYTQALRVWSDGSGKHHEFYWDLPDTSKVIRRTEPSSYGNAMPPSPALTWGDAPWNPSNEILKGVLRGIQIYTVSLSVSDIQAEIATPRSTSAGTSNLWYLNINPTPSDISDKSGAGHHPAWVGNERPLLWTGP